MSSLEDVDIYELTYEQLVRHGHHVNVLHADLDKRLKAIKKQLNKLARRPGSLVVGDVSLSMSKSNNFSPELAVATLSRSQLRSISETKPNADKAKEYFGEDSAEYAALCTESENYTIRFSAASTAKKIMAADGRLTDPFSEDSEEE